MKKSVSKKNGKSGFEGSESMTGTGRKIRYIHAVDSPVAVVEAGDKFSALDEALEKSEFFPFLQRKRQAAGKERSELRIAVKPNLMMFVSRKEMDVITDPELVEHLLSRLRGEGYTRVALVESQNVYSNWYENRLVSQVARAAGYTSTFTDLTLAAPLVYDSPFMGPHRISSALREIDVLVSFAKSKTHIASLVTLGIKNCFGLTWEQDKYAKYHGRWGASINHALMPTITNPDLPYVSNSAIFTIVDAWTSLDGLMGFKSARWEIPNPCRFMGYGSFCGTPLPLPGVLRVNLGARRETGTIIAGEDLMRVERVGMIKMGVPESMRRVNFPYWLMARTFGEPDIGKTPLRGGVKNQGRELAPYDQPQRRFYSIGYSGKIGTPLFDVLIPWSAKFAEKFYFLLNIVSSFSPVDLKEFPKKSYFQIIGTEHFVAALPGRHMGLLFLKAIKNLALNFSLIFCRSTWRNMYCFFRKKY